MYIVDFDPVALYIFSWPIKWYAVSYILSLILSYILIRYIINTMHKYKFVFDKKVVLDACIRGVIGAIIGGRVGHVTFYDLEYYLENVEQIIAVWNGGMSFHGGFIGGAIAVLLFNSQKNQISRLLIADLLVLAAPIYSIFVRIANFINGELWGRITDLPWGMYFMRADENIRHPSQLYQAFFEGIVLFIINFIIFRYLIIKKKLPFGSLAAVFIIFSMTARFLLEFVREPEFVVFNGAITIGQLLCLLMPFVGLIFMYINKRF